MLFYLRLLDVGLFVEVRKEIVEENGVHSNPPNKSTRIVAVDKQKLESVDEHQHKLNLNFNFN